MPKNFKKLLVCIVATFGITAMVFSCCKKVGLCASSENNAIKFSPPPFLVGEGIGAYDNFDHSDILYILDDAITRNTNYNGGPVIVENYINSFFVGFLTGTPTYSSSTADFNVNYSVTYEYSKGTLNLSNVYSNGGVLTIQVSQVYETINNQDYYKSNYSAWYPIAIYNCDNFYFSNGSLVFSVVDLPIGPVGHSKGGVLSNYIDSVDLIEDSSDLPKVDTSAPSNSSSIPDWLQKILNALGRVNQSIQGGVLTIGDYIGSMTDKIGEWFQGLEDSISGFFDRVHDTLDDIIDTIEGLKDGSTVAQAQSVWQSEFNNSVFKDFVDLKSTIESDILTPIKNANAPSTLSFTIPLITVNVPRLVNSGGSVSTSTNNVYLFGQSVTLDFSWYTRSISGGVFNGSSIRDYLVPIIATFLYVGMVVHLLFKIPSFLNGSSGFSNTLHSVVVSNNGSKFKKA